MAVARRSRWIKEGKYALNWTRLSCHKFVANQVRLWLFVLTYNLGNFMRRLVLPEDMKHWTLTSLQTRLIKTGGRLVRHARRLVFQLAEVLVTREMLTGILERDQPASAGTWLACLLRAQVFRTVMGSSGVNRPPRGRRLGRGRQF